MTKGELLDKMPEVEYEIFDSVFSKVFGAEDCDDLREVSIEDIKKLYEATDSDSGNAQELAKELSSIYPDELLEWYAENFCYRLSYVNKFIKNEDLLNCDDFKIEPILFSAQISYLTDQIRLIHEGLKEVM